MTLPRLAPSHALSEVIPERAAMSARYWPEPNPWLPTTPGRCEMSSANLWAAASDLLTVAHRAAITPLAEDFLGRAGLECGPSRGYTDLHDYLATLRELSAEGRVLALNFTPPAEFRDFPQVLVPADVQAFLNDKGNLTELVPFGAAPERVVIPREKLLADVSSPARLPVVLKAASWLPNGGGLDVRICRTADEWDAALRFFRDNAAFLSGVVVERFEAFRDTWCAHVGIRSDRVDYWGAPRQICSAAGQWQGNWMGEGFELPEAARDVVLHVAEQGQKRGYRGVVGMDLGLTEDGRLLVFDLNFRINGCTFQLLFHAAACARSGARVSRLRRFRFRRSLSDAIDAIAPWVDRGDFLPESAFDAALHPDVEHASISGIVLGADPAEVEARILELESLG